MAAPGVAQTIGVAAADPSPLEFVVIGDAPYDELDEIMLRKAVKRINGADYPFVIHVGDYKGGRAPCLDVHDEAMATLIESLQPTPVFYTPGDNEWTDCDRHIDPATGERVSDLDRLAKVRGLFAVGTPAGAEAFDYRRQEIMAENATWRHRDVRFVTIHVTGTNNGRDWVAGDDLIAARIAVAARDAANLEWLSAGFAAAKEEGAKALVIAMQGDPTNVKSKPADVMCDTVAPSNKHPCDGFADLRAAIAAGAEAFGAPVLLIHGDTAPFTLNQRLSGEEADNLWRLNAAGDIAVRDVTLVQVSPASATPFGARGLLTGRSPKTR